MGKRINTKEQRHYSIRKVSGKAVSVFIGATIFSIALGAGVPVSEVHAATDSTAVTASNTANSQKSSSNDTSVAAESSDASAASKSSSSEATTSSTSTNNADAKSSDQKSAASTSESKTAASSTSSSADSTNKANVASESSEKTASSSASEQKTSSAASSSSQASANTTSESTQSNDSQEEKATNSSANETNNTVDVSNLKNMAEASQLKAAALESNDSSSSKNSITPDVTFTESANNVKTDFISSDYYIYGAFHENNPAGHGPDWYLTVKSDGSEPGTIYVFEKGNATPTKLVKGADMKLFLSGDTLVNYGDSYLISSANKGDKTEENFKDMVPQNGQMVETGDWVAVLNDFNPVLGKVSIQYRDVDTDKEIPGVDPTVYDKMTGTNYSVGAAPTIPGYSYVKTEGATQGTVSNFNFSTIGDTKVIHFVPYSLGTKDIYAEYTYLGWGPTGYGRFEANVKINYYNGTTQTLGPYELGVDDSTNAINVETPFDGKILLTGVNQRYNGDVIFYYKKDESQVGNVTVNYIDLDANNKVLESKSLSGDYGTQINYSTADTIKSLENKGYKLVADGFNQDGQDFSDSNNGKVYEVTFKHATTTITPDNPQTPDTPINPNDPDSPKYTSDQTNVSKDVKQTVHYTGAGDQTPADNVKTGTITRTVTIDKVTGETISSTPWTSNEFPSVDTPEVSGYTPDKTVAGGFTATYDNPEETFTVTYTKNPDVIETTTESKTVKRTIEYIDKKTGKAIPASLAKPVEQDVTLKRTVSNNKTTGKVTYGDWTVESGSWDEVDSPDLTNYGYTAPDKASVAAEVVNGNTENSDVKVYYDHATTTVTPDNPQNPNTPINPNDPNSPKYTSDQTTVTKDVKQTVHYTGAGDQTPADNVKTGTITRTVTIDKVTGETISSTPWTTNEFSSVDTPAVSGYTPDKTVAGGFTATYDNPEQTFTVTYIKNSDDVDTKTESKTVKRTIEYLDKQTGEAIPSKLAKPVEQDVILTRTVSTNKTTGKVTYGDWSVESGSWNKVDSPDLTNYGYTAPDKASVAAVTVDGNTENSDVKVYYDHATTTVTPDNPKNPNTPINPNNPDGPKYTSDQTDVTRDASQTVHYTGAGDKTPADKVQTQKDAFTRTVTIDKVTGETISSTPWTGTKTFGTENTPVVDGYHADKKVAGGLTATPENPNVEDTVTYAANGKIIPVDPNGNKIPNVPNPTYPTDPTDPTKVTPDEPVPNIPGYTPEVPTVTPSDPGKDTPVVYYASPAAIVNFIDEDYVNAQGEKVPTQIGTSGGLTGKIGETIIYSGYNAKLQSYLDKGYVLDKSEYPTKDVYDNDDKTLQTFNVYLKHGTTTVTPDNPQNPNTPINPNNPDGPKYTEDQTDVTRDASQTVHYTGAGDNTPSDNVQTQKNAFTRTVTVDKVTGKTISTTPWTGSKTFGSVDTPVVDGYHADKKVAGGLTATPENPNVTNTVTYTTNGKIVPVDPNGNKIPDAPTPTYPTDPTDPTKVTPDEPVPNIPGYTPETPTVTPSNPGEDTPVVYNKKDSSLTVKYVDQDNNDAVLETKDLSGKYGDKITYTTADTIKSLEDKGYELVSDGYTGKVGSEFGDSNNGQTYVVVFKHGTTTVTPDNPKNPNTPINPNNPDGPKYTEDQTDVTRDASQTVHYTGAGDNTPSDNVQTQKNAFTRTVTVDKVTGKTISTTPWTGSKTFGSVDTPVVDGYHADKKVAGGLTATPENPNVTDTVTYTTNGKIVPVDPNGNKIPDAPTPTYPTDPTDPTKVTPDEPVPNIPGYTPETPTVTPSNPGEDTPVVYNKKDSSLTVKYVDQDNNDAVLETKDLSGKYGDKITYTTADTIKSLEDKGYELVSDGYTGKVGSEFGDSNNGQTYVVVFKHGTTTVTPDNPKNPNTPINPNNPDGPKYTEDQTDVTRDASQTVHYTGAGDNTPSDNVQTQKNAFTRTVTVDKVTGKTISTTPWTGSKTFGNVSVPVVNGYHSDKKVAGGLTATPENPNVTDTVTYTTNGKIIPVDPNGNKIPNAPTPTYPTDPNDPTKVTPDEPVPDIPGYTPSTPTVTPENPGKDTTVVYTKKPGKETDNVTPEKPSKPSTPSTPSKPNTGKTVENVTPKTPETPNKSKKTVVKEVSDVKAEPAKQVAQTNNNSSELPQTGENEKTAWSVAGVLLAGAAFLFGLADTRKRKRH
ncbi:mucin-binding protein [Lactobacillus corticis]|uniref:Gram-positive cocci surface proteins LPxTG domain-containing protein n=1 Tax=Lactobacillus corticis TaxID=2201249 RepID=A0A916QFY5_9LACO|nr:LPXTG cell wall anchor domain-containing protein [Lactobacillus corticis]GFZ26289.1 hypothetical protein LCB40_01690 [Lactobacillus corticis]